MKTGGNTEEIKCRKILKKAKREGLWEKSEKKNGVSDPS